MPFRAFCDRCDTPIADQVTWRAFPGAGLGIDVTVTMEGKPGTALAPTFVCNDCLAELLLTAFGSMKETRAVREYVATKRAAEEVVATRASLQSVTAERDDLKERLAKAEAANEPGAWDKERAALTAQVEALKQDVALAQTLDKKTSPRRLSRQNQGSRRGTQKFGRSIEM